METRGFHLTLPVPETVRIGLQHYAEHRAQPYLGWPGSRVAIDDDRYWRMGGMLQGADLVLLTTTGARSGKQHVVPLGYLTDGKDRVVLWAANMAAANHPAWYWNVVADPQVIIERRTPEGGIDRYMGTAHTASGAERQRLFGQLGEQFPHIAAHQQQAEREIPLVVVERAE